MIAVIGEKPSVARDIARILGVSEKQDGKMTATFQVTGISLPGRSAILSVWQCRKHTAYRVFAGKVCLLSRIVFNLHPDK